MNKNHTPTGAEETAARFSKKQLALIAEHNNWAALRYNSMGQIVSHPSDPKADNGWIVRDEADLRERLQRAEESK